MTIVIERETILGNYDMPYEMLVVDHPRHGRLLLVEGWGGMHSLRGGAYRWEQGAAYRLQADDTLDGLRAREWNEWASTLDAVLKGYDDSRPVLLWHGSVVRSVAMSAEGPARA